VLYASLLDESRARYWLFLEEVQGWRLDWCKTEVWERAFRWLAAMHARYYGGEDELRAMNCLREHGAAFYWRRAREAREKLARYGEPHWLTRFDALMERFDETVAHLEEQPCTLVHGSPSCNHFIVEKGGALRLVDWEGAAIGLPAWDLERLLEGWGERKPRLIASYLAEFAKHAEAPSAAALERDVLHLTVLRAHRYLYWWGRACRDPAFIEGLLTSIERAYRRLEALEVARRG
jgi:aminoglycoside phosphotransferase (APT) family kinase protein